MNSALISRFSDTSAYRRSVVAGLCLAALAALTGPSFGQAQTADPLVVVVNGTEIRESDVRVADRELGREIPIVEPDIRREQIISYLIDTTLLSKDALDRNIVNEAELWRRIAFTRNKGLMENLLTVTARNAVTEEAVRKAYHDFVETTGHEPELRLRAITYQVSDPNDQAAMQEAEDKAKAARERIAGGEDFAAVAGATSPDPTVRANGGEIGYRTRAEMGKEYAEVAFTLEIGAVSQPIRSAVGWHLLQIEDKRERKPLAYETVHDSLQGLIARRAQLELISKLHTEAKIERHDKPDQYKSGQLKPGESKPDHAEQPEVIAK